MLHNARQKTHANSGYEAANSRPMSVCMLVLRLRMPCPWFEHRGNASVGSPCPATQADIRACALHNLLQHDFIHLPGTVRTSDSVLLHADVCLFGFQAVWLPLIIFDVYDFQLAMPFPDRGYLRATVLTTLARQQPAGVPATRKRTNAT